MIVAQPFEKGDAFGQIFCRNAGRARLQGFRRRGQLRQHFLPVAHCHAHLREHGFRPQAQFLPPRAPHDRGEHQRNHAFVDCCAIFAARTVRIAQALHDGVKHGADACAFRVYFRQKRIEQERHIVVHRDQNGVVVAVSGFVRSRIEQRHKRFTGFAGGTFREHHACQCAQGCR